MPQTRWGHEALSDSDKTPRKRKSSLPKLITQYYADLQDLAHQNVMYEMGTRPAFHTLLQGTGKEHGCRSGLRRRSGSDRSQMNAGKRFIHQSHESSRMNPQPHSLLFVSIRDPSWTACI
jgi:hypothetical protein